MSPPVNPEMVTLAREARRMTQGELAERLSVSQAKISKIEAGLLGVSQDLLGELSNVLEYPEDFFLQQERRAGIGIGEYFHRKKSSLPVKVLDAIHADLEIRRLHVGKLMKAASIDQIRPLPTLSIEDYNNDAAEVARVLRATWQLPSGPLKDLTMSIEEAGGIVFHCTFGTPLVDGISRAFSDRPPMFFLNAAMPGCRYRYTLAHELGHVIMHDVPNPDIEEQANLFAAELLMPAAEIGPSLTGLTLQKLAMLKRVWRVSMGALLKRASDLRKITDRQTREFWMQMGKLGYRTREPAELDVPMESPSLLQELIDYHANDLNYSADELSRLICLKEREFLKTYSVKTHGKAKLRVV